MSQRIAHLSEYAQFIARYLDSLTESQIEVPLLPDVANRVVLLSNDPDSDSAQLARLIQGDQSLAGHVMRIANSAAYTPNASLVSLQQAVARLGMNLISEIALAASLNTKLFKAPPYEKRISEIWAHALCTGLWGKEVARISKKNVEAAFLCGLLHSIGCPVILQIIYEYGVKQGISISDEEAFKLEQLFKLKFGKVIVQKWGMPNIVQESVRHYQHYDEAKQYRDQAMVTHAAAILATAMLSTEDREMEDLFNDSVFADLNLYDDDLEAIQNQFDKVSTALGAMRS